MSFMVDDQRVSFGMDNVYFMNGLSCRGEVVNLCGGSCIEGALSGQEHIDVYYDEGIENIAS